MFPRSCISKKCVLAAFALSAVILAGCGPKAGYALREEDEPAYQRGEVMLRENRRDEALLAFESVVDARRDCPESHLELGRIYMDHVKDPISAIYHFRKYLELVPDSDVSKQVTQLIETAKKDFARSLPGDPLSGMVSGGDLADQYKKLRAENDDLKRALAALQEPARSGRSGQSAAPVAPAPSVQPSAAAQPVARAASSKAYTVQAGDTLSKISQNVYGTTSRWQEIYDANRDQLKNPHDLKVGMALMVP
jgi:LysM repeat protein